MDIKRLNGQFHRSTEPSPGVLLLEFNRPPVNVFHDAMWTEMGQIVNRASFDPSVRVIVLSSTTDKIFTGGLDHGGALTDTGLSDPARRAFALHEHILVDSTILGLVQLDLTLQDFQAAISTLANCRAPVIGALHGAALGLAIDLASACDIRLAAENVTFGIMEINVGLAADIGTLQRFPKIVGNDSIARELALTGRKFGAAEAKEIGFVSRVIKGGRAEVVAAAIEMAKIIAEKSPVAAVSTKHLMNHSRDHSVREGLEYTAAWNMSMLQSNDTLQAMKATLAKKSASFPPLGPAPKAKL